MNRGPLLCLDTFTTPAANGPPKMKPFTVFLFEQILIFSEIVGKKTQFTSPVYVYKAHFLVRANSCLAWSVCSARNNTHSCFLPPVLSVVRTVRVVLCHRGSEGKRGSEGV